MKAGRELRRLVIARIKDQVPALVGRVYDQARPATPHPYCTLGTSDARRDDVDCIKGKTWSLQIDIWHTGAAKGEVEDLVDDIEAALDDFLAAEPGMPEVKVLLTRVLDDPSGNVHGVVQIEAMVEDT